MAKRDWRKDRKLRDINHGISQAKESLNDLTNGAGKPMWSDQLNQYVSPKRGKRIDPQSEQGKAIAKRYGIHD